MFFRHSTLALACLAALQAPTTNGEQIDDWKTHDFEELDVCLYNGYLRTKKARGDFPSERTIERQLKGSKGSKGGLFTSSGATTIVTDPAECVPDACTSSEKSYAFLFENLSTGVLECATGAASDNDILVSVGGVDREIHVSCSDCYSNGFSDKGRWPGSAADGYFVKFWIIDKCSGAGSISERCNACNDKCSGGGKGSKGGCGGSGKGSKSSSKGTKSPSSTSTGGSSKGSSKSKGTKSPSSTPTGDSCAPSYGPEVCCIATGTCTQMPSSAPNSNAQTAEPTASPTIGTETAPPTSSPTHCKDPPTKPPTPAPTIDTSTPPPTEAPTEPPTKSPTTSPTHCPPPPTKDPTPAPTIDTSTPPPTESPTETPTSTPSAAPVPCPVTCKEFPGTEMEQAQFYLDNGGNPTLADYEAANCVPPFDLGPCCFPYCNEDGTKRPNSDFIELCVPPPPMLECAPSAAPSKTPTKSPTESPTKSPTTSPTESPTKSPTESPTKSPTESPTKSPTDTPTKYPTKTPTKNPTPGPTIDARTEPPQKSMRYLEEMFEE